MIWTVLLVLLGFFLLTKGADLLVDGASHLAYKLGVTPLFVGLTVVAFGTSTPELAINLLAAHAGRGDIALGNVVGSNLANMALIAGVGALVRPMHVQSLIVVREIPFLFLTGLALWFLADDVRFQPGAHSAFLSRGDGLVMLLFFAIFLYYLAAGARAGKQQGAKLAEGVIEAQDLRRPIRAGRAVVMVLLGLTGLILGGHWVVEGSSSIARALGWSDALIAVTIVAIGTSLPELVTSAVAARRGASDLALGNIVGSSIFNTVAVLGLTAVARPLMINPQLLVDIVIMLGAALALFVVTLRHRIVHRWEGALLTLGYLVYLAYVAARA